MKANVPADVNWTAGFAGALAVSPSDASPDEAPRSGDLETAKLLGRRVAELATRSREVVHGVKGVAADL
jgi:NAD(P)H dehydrogenase (quinone)